MWSFCSRLKYLAGIAALLSLFAAPNAASASITYGTDFAYQENDSTSGGITTSTAQEKFGFDFNVLSAPSSKLTITGIFRLDAINNTTNAGSSFELDPDLNIRMATKAAQLGFGYRVVDNTTNIISNSQTQTQRTKSTDAFADSSITLGALPSIRLRYDLLQQSQSTSGTQNSDTQTGNFQAAANYRLGILTFNGDYGDQQTTDKMTGIVQDQTTVAAQAAVAKRIGDRLDLGAREDYNYTQTATAGQTLSKAYISTSELRGSYVPIKGAQLSGSYLYTLGQTFQNAAPATTDKEDTYFGSANYAFPKYLRVYGSYVLHDANTGLGPTSSSQALAGMNLNHNVGIFTFNSRYERRMDSTSAQGTATTSDSQDNLDWLLSAHPAQFLNMALSESLVHTAVSAGTSNSSNQFRFITNIGPIRNLALSPYADYTLTTSSGAPSATSTEAVVPLTFRLNLHQRLLLDIADMYRMNWTGGGNTASTSTTQNNADVRLSLARPLPGTVLSAEATFNTTSGSATPTASTSSYSVQGSWASQPHSLNFNVMYQTSTSAPATMSFATQYGLTLRLRNLAFSLQARYDYSKVFSQDRNDSQGIFISLNLRK